MPRSSAFVVLLLLLVQAAVAETDYPAKCGAMNCIPQNIHLARKFNQ